MIANILRTLAALRRIVETSQQICSSEWIEINDLEVSGRIPAGAYYQVRLKLSEAAALPPETAELLRAKGCRSAARSGCVVSADGVVHELQTLDMQGFLVVQTILPVDVRAGRENRVQLRFHPEWVLKQSATGAIELAPLLEGEVIVRP